MPQLKYIGKYYMSPGPRGFGKTVYRGETYNVTQEWCDKYSSALGSDYELIGSESKTVDALDDGIPDSGWRVGDIKKWLRTEGVSFGAGYRTKGALLGLVEEHLNPAPPVVEVAEVPEVAEEQTME
tara:strand:- start:210 stop:587 length:378 start_codon:yes stop_codon:yes gene_type:complete